MTLGEIRGRPGLQFREVGHRDKYMVLHLCAGMIREGGSSGGAARVAVASLQTGNTMFMDADTCIEAA